MKYWLTRNKVIIFLLLILTILLNGCNKNDSLEQSNSSVVTENENAPTDTIQENSNKEDSTNTGNEQDNSGQQSESGQQRTSEPQRDSGQQQSTSEQNSSGMPSDLSKEMDEFYQAWNQDQIKLNENAFVNYYYLIRENSDTLMIYLEGSGDASVMGVKEGDNWIRGGNPYSFAKKRFPNYDFLTMDNVNVTMGGDHFMDPAVTNEYTFDNRVKSAVAVIDTFLNNSKKEYKDVIIFGISQGGQILPRVYSSLERKNDITKLIVLGSGGLSQYEDFMILKDSDLPMEPGFKEGYAAIEEAYPDILEHPDSVERQYFGYTYKMWSGFLQYKPLDDYLNIDIPILLLHGAKDFNSSVESARAVDTEFQAAGKTNLKYIEYPDMGHGPESKEQSEQLFGDINRWLEGKE